MIECNILMEYAVIETGGKQYRVKKGDVLSVEKLSGGKNGEILLDKVLLYVSDSDIKIGNPYLANLKVKAKILANLKGDKIRVVKFRAKSRYRRTTGHRQSILRIEIQKIEVSK